jgi:hypothetical protein
MLGRRRWCMRFVRLCLVLQVVGASSLLAACGGGGSDRPSAAEFAKRGNAICRKYEAKQPRARPKTLNEAVPYFEQTKQLMQQEASGFARLKPPRGEEAAYRRLLDFIRADEQLVEDFLAAAKKHDASQLQAVAERARNLHPRRIAKALGLSDCAKAA